ncbi:type III PLP-dependent enzyme, partial [Actinomadura kijaniata]|uniref:type III PLP-dependent enzyme n=1 Tax=Actinomadura kijaniata TaxID=46161 RepID=UPI003F1D0E4A
MITEAVRERATELAAGAALPAFVYDLAALRGHAAEVRAALDRPGAPELFYAAAANPEPPILLALAPFTDGVHTACGGELEHVRTVLPDARLTSGGTGAELAAALDHGAERLHVESPHELRRLAALGRDVDVLLRVGHAGGPSGMDFEAMEECRAVLADAPRLRLRGLHTRPPSGPDAADLLRRTREFLDRARPWAASAGCEDPEFTFGGMAVDYTDPGHRFDWPAYAAGLAELARPGETFRVEPGRALSVYSGWYVTEVLDVRRTHGDWYAVLRGGTMHLRAPAVEGRDQPFTVLPRGGRGPSTDEPVTLVGQLLTPEDVLARRGPGAGQERGQRAGVQAQAGAGAGQA